MRDLAEIALAIPILILAGIVWVLYTVITTVRPFPRPWTRYVHRTVPWNMKVWRRVVGPIYVRIPVAWAERETARLQRGNG
jgi:hypothetical protein